jgi:hypothetical protein
MEAEVGVIHLQTKKLLQIPDAGKGNEWSSYRGLRESMFLSKP